MSHSLCSNTGSAKCRGPSARCKRIPYPFFWQTALFVPLRRTCVPQGGATGSVFTCAKNLLQILAEGLMAMNYQA